MIGYVGNINSFVAQFPEWQRFAENVASANIMESDIEYIHMSVASFIEDTVKEEKDILDDEVPKTLQYLNSLIANPSKFSKQAAFAVMRTIENLVGSAAIFVTEIIKDTLNETKSKIVKKSSTLLVWGLLALAVSGTNAIHPFIGGFGDFGWMQQVRVYAQRQLDQIGR
jgi:hypothetical protein